MKVQKAQRRVQQCCLSACGITGTDVCLMELLLLCQLPSYSLKKICSISVSLAVPESSRVIFWSGGGCGVGIFWSGHSIVIV